MIFRKGRNRRDEREKKKERKRGNGGREHNKERERAQNKERKRERGRERREIKKFKRKFVIEDEQLETAFHSRITSFLDEWVYLFFVFNT